MREKNPSMNKTVIRVEQQPSKCRKGDCFKKKLRAVLKPWTQKIRL